MFFSMTLQKHNVEQLLSNMCSLVLAQQIGNFKTVSMLAGVSVVLCSGQNSI